MRRLLDLLYGSSAFLAALCVVGILGSVAFQVLSRFIAVTFDATEISGFCLAAAIFLGLGYTFHSGAHIRMTSLISSAQGPRKRLIELYCTAVSAVVAAYITFYAADMTIDSFSFGDKSPGLMAVPFWIPQIAMVVGLAILTVGFVDEFVSVLQGKVPSFKDVEELELDEAMKELPPVSTEVPPVPPRPAAARS